MSTQQPSQEAFAPTTPTLTPASPAANITSITAHLGIDVSKAKLDVALLRGGKARSKAVDNNASGFAALLAWILSHSVQPQQLHVCMEATGPYSLACALALSDAGCRVSVVNPARIKGFGQGELVRNKTDVVDAALIARFCATMAPEPWQPPSASQRRLRGLVDRLQDLQAIEQQERNRLQGVDDSVRGNITAHLTYLEQATESLKREIDEHIDGEPELRAQAKLLASIDAVGAITASKVLAYAGDIHRFANARSFSAFIGVAPRLKTSGSSIKGRTVMGKGGSNALRSALFMPAMVALRYNKHVMQLAERLRAKGMKGKALIGAAMHKLAHLIYGVIKTRQPYSKTWGMQQSGGQEQEAQMKQSAGTATTAQPALA